jgi:hypothetical protein
VSLPSGVSAARAERFGRAVARERSAATRQIAAVQAPRGKFQADLLAEAGEIDGVPHCAAVDSMARPANVRQRLSRRRALTAIWVLLASGRGDLPDLASWQEMKVHHPRHERRRALPQSVAALSAAPTTITSKEPQSRVNFRSRFWRAGIRCLWRARPLLAPDLFAIAFVHANGPLLVAAILPSIPSV